MHQRDRISPPRRQARGHHRRRGGVHRRRGCGVGGRGTQRRLPRHREHDLRADSAARRALWPGRDLVHGQPATYHAAGVVLIDEVDAHLHPTWQREIGYWFTRWFPNIQFIVTTHSPLICQAAERGSILRLPSPGHDEYPRVVTGLERERLLYGNVLDAYGSASFDYVPTRSDAGRQKLDRLAELNQKALHEGLSDEELDEREHLLRVMPTGRSRSLDAAE
ncbi:MAG: AAA family ATPase [Deltaproteobacteria bacterium]|nr:AAA family ATPase [Deltaproteobacteria bacterium]